MVVTGRSFTQGEGGELRAYVLGESLRTRPPAMGMVLGVIDSPQPQHTVLSKQASYEIRR